MVVGLGWGFTPTAFRDIGAYLLSVTVYLCRSQRKAATYYGLVGRLWPDLNPGPNDDL